MQISKTVKHVVALSYSCNYYMNPKLVIFDYDGTLVDSQPLAFIASHYVLAKYGVNHTHEVDNKNFGMPIADSFTEWVALYGIDANPHELVRMQEDYLIDLIRKELKLMRGAHELLGFLRHHDIRAVIGSSSNERYIKIGLEKMGMMDVFANITTVDEVERGKPHPDIFLTVLKKNNTHHHEAIVLEDSLQGMRAAKNAGIFSIGIPNHTTDIQPHRQVADVIVGSLLHVSHMIQFFLVK